MSLAGAAAVAGVSWRWGERGGPAPVDTAVESAAATITPADMAAWIGALAHDTMLGRQTPSAGLDWAAYSARLAFSRAGLDPLFGTSYDQYYVPPKGPPDALAPNVGAWRRGRDGTLRHEYVLYVAHMDHVGVGIPVNGDSVYNGADDNASGSSAVLEIAEALGALEEAPRRSVIVLLVSGEEHGFWGSRYFVNVPPVPLDKIVAVINLDMVSRNHPDTMTVSGMEISEMGDAVRAAAAAHPEDHLAVVRGSAGRSDQMPFDERGIPWLLFFSGLHVDYHRPSDEPSHSDADKAARVARLAFRTGMIVANMAARPIYSGPP